MLTFTIDNTMEALATGAERLERYCEEAGLSTALAYRANLAYEELVSNIIKYGYRDTAAHTIAIEFDGSPVACRLRITDDSNPFNPFHDATKPELEIPLEERPIGGLGVYLIRQMVRSFHYERAGNRNIVTIEFVDEAPDGAAMP